jgi:hypothetical protein
MDHKTKPAAPDNKLFKVPSKSFPHEKSNVLIFLCYSMTDDIKNFNKIISNLQITAASYLMELAASD